MHGGGRVQESDSSSLTSPLLGPGAAEWLSIHHFSCSIIYSTSSSLIIQHINHQSIYQTSSMIQ
jgi:hypothetical protein